MAKTIRWPNRPVSPQTGFATSTHLIGIGPRTRLGSGDANVGHDTLLVHLIALRGTIRGSNGDQVDELALAGIEC